MAQREPAASEPAQGDGQELRVSVVIPTYRRPRSLRSCLDGLLRQSRPPDEIVVVVRPDDEPSHQAIATFCRDQPSMAQRLRKSLVDRPGQIPSLNTGLSAATGDVVCFTDDDCVPRSDWIERLLSHYSDESVGGVGGRDVVHYGDEVVRGTVAVVGRFTWFGRPIGNHHLELDPPRPVDVDILKGANMSFRRRLLPGFDERLQLGAAQCNDLDASLSVRRMGYRLVYDPAAVVDHYPAQRHGEATRQYDAPHMLFAEGHNWMYVALKHSRPWQVPVLLAYGFLVGHARAYGLLRALWGAFQVGPLIAAHRLWHSLRGKTAGIISWLRQRKKVHSGG